MIDVGIEQLQLSSAKPPGFIPKPSLALRQRIAKHGILDPVVVRRVGPSRYEILSNPVVWVAAGEAGLHSVPVVVRDDMDDEEAAEIVGDHYQTPRLNPIDEAQTFDDELQALGGQGAFGAIARLARKLGHSRTYVAHALRLLALPKAVQALIRSGKLSPGQARPLVTVPGSDLQVRLAQRILAEGMSAREAEVMAAEHRLGKPSAFREEEPAVDPNVARLEQAVSELLGCPMEIRDGEMVINFFGNYEVLDGVLRQLGYRGD